MSVEAVSITLNPIDVTIRSSGEKVTVSSSNVQIVTAGKVGPPGPAGASADGSFEWVTQAFELVDVQQEFILDDEPRAGSVFIYLNGLLEQFWSLIDTTITLDDIAVAGDTVIITYQKEI